MNLINLFWNILYFQVLTIDFCSLVKKLLKSALSSHNIFHELCLVSTCGWRTSGVFSPRCRPRETSPCIQFNGETCHPVSSLTERLHPVSSLTEKLHPVSSLTEKLHPVSSLKEKLHSVSSLTEDKIQPVSSLMKKLQIVSSSTEKLLPCIQLKVESSLCIQLNEDT